MTKDYSQYQKIITQFRGKVLSNDFNSKFLVATKNILKTDRFLLKMELKRLATPCVRALDLREYAQETCLFFEYGNQQHILDQDAIDVFNENVKAYGEYTFGVYEAVINFRDKIQPEHVLITPDNSPQLNSKINTNFLVKFYQFGPYFNRSQERMNYATPLQLTLSDDYIVDAISSDISESGCKIRLNTTQVLRIGQVIKVTFSQFKTDFSVDVNNEYSYKVCNIYFSNNIQFIGLSRVYDNETTDSLRHFLRDYIQNNKSRYKINMENTLNAIRSRSFEHFSLPKSNELAVFIEQYKDTMLPRYALTTNNNEFVYRYWKNESNQSQLHCLITAARINRLKKAATLGRTLLVYSFIHENQGKSYFYTADEKQLTAEPSLMAKFLSFSASKTSFAITNLTIIKNNEALAHSPLTLSNSLPNEALPNDSFSDEVATALSNLPYIIVANAINHEHIIQEYAQLPFDKNNLASLKVFGHQRAFENKIDEVFINYHAQELEPRYHYKTPVLFTSSNKVIQGQTQDISISGLKIKLAEEIQLQKGDIVNLTLPDLQKRTVRFNLKKLAYHVTQITKAEQVVHLKTVNKRLPHQGKLFFKELIEKNKEKLSTQLYETIIPGLAKALRNIYSQSLINPALMIQTDGNGYNIEALVSGAEHGKILSHMRHLSTQKSFYNVYPILNKIQKFDAMISELKTMQENDVPLISTLYIAINPNGESIERSVTTKLETELTSQKLKQIFINNALKHGHFFCLQAKLSRTEKPEMSYLAPELDYISTYFKQKAKEIESDNSKVIGVMQLFDITQEALIRHKCMTDKTK
ncbi:MAG: hypothetical protein ACI9LM_000192 [Alteromonadaceae bacterium]|jgi:hypothetical protein